jgi:hypothetical protein
MYHCIRLLSCLISIVKIDQEKERDKPLKLPRRKAWHLLKTRETEVLFSASLFSAWEVGKIVCRVSPRFCL